MAGWDIKSLILNLTFKYLTKSTKSEGSNLEVRLDQFRKHGGNLGGNGNLGGECNLGGKGNLGAKARIALQKVIISRLKVLK